MKKINFLTQAAMIAALYVVLTLAINAFGLASGAIQVRVSEALTILPYFTPAAIPGLFIGCLLSNTITGCALFDIIFGSIATLLGAVGTYLLRRHKWLAPVSPIIANTIIVPFVLSYVYGTPGTIPYLMLTVGIGGSAFLRRFGHGSFICTEQIQNDTLRSAKLNIRRSESPPATADAASAGHDRNIFPQMPFFFQIYLLYVIKQFPFASK